jgi:hypothetical protein
MGGRCRRRYPWDSLWCLGWPSAYAAATYRWLHTVWMIRNMMREIRPYQGYPPAGLAPLNLNSPGHQTGCPVSGFVADSRGLMKFNY